MAACDTTGPSGPPRANANAVVGVSLATSMSSPRGSWAVVPMGHLGDPLNTFWQLFYRPRGATRWVDEAASLAIATNGGIVMGSAVPAGQVLAVGVRPANLLNFSPMLRLGSAASSWTPVAPLGVLADSPSALAIAGAGRSYALVGEGTAGKVLAAPPGLARWGVLTTVAALGATPAGRTCQLRAATAVGLDGREVLVGAACGRRGTVGVFSRAGSRWRLAGPALPASLRDGAVTVLGLVPTTAGLGAVLAITGNTGTRLVAAWLGVGSSRWRVSSALVARSSSVASIGPDGTGGLFVLSTQSSGHEVLNRASAPGAGWRSQSVPAGTATVAFRPGGVVDALVVNDTIFSDWAIGGGRRHWTKAQVTKVSILFGSSQ